MPPPNGESKAPIIPSSPAATGVPATRMSTPAASEQRQRAAAWSQPRASYERVRCASSGTSDSGPPPSVVSKRTRSSVPIALSAATSVFSKDGCARAIQSSACGKKSTDGARSDASCTAATTACWEVHHTPCHRARGTGLRVSITGAVACAQGLRPTNLGRAGGICQEHRVLERHERDAIASMQGRADDGLRAPGAAILKHKHARPEDAARNARHERRRARRAVARERIKVQPARHRACRAGGIR